MKKILFVCIFILSIFLPPYCYAAENNLNKFITLVYPIRGRNLWDTKDLNQVNNLFNLLKIKNYSSTWLWQYDAIADQDLVNKFKTECQKCEMGVFLEVSQEQATASWVSYDLSDSDWAKPSKVFLSGYYLLERKRLIDATFSIFKNKFGYYPVSIGAWYVDPYSLNYVIKKYGVKAYVSVADQYDTDGQRYWGKPWGYPFYPQKFNILASATNIENKLNVVELQWAQRDPDLGYGSGVFSSQNSFQANDYLGNKNTTDYFLSLLNKYSKLGTNPFIQVTLGLETGQELSRFENEHLKQIENLNNFKVIKVGDFANWYQKTFPDLSPTTFVQGDRTVWVNTSDYRMGLKQTTAGWEVFDFRDYGEASISKDSYSRETNKFLSREITARKFNGNVNNLVLWEEIKESIKEKLSVFKKSKLDGKMIFGIQVGKKTIFAYWQGKGIGLYSFPFQVLAKFQKI